MGLRLKQEVTIFPMSGGHWSSASGDVKFLMCHMISQDHVIEGSCVVTGGREPLMVSGNLAKFDGHKYCDSTDMIFLKICCVILKDHVTKKPRDFTGRSPLK